MFLANFAFSRLGFGRIVALHHRCPLYTGLTKRTGALFFEMAEGSDEKEREREKEKKCKQGQGDGTQGNDHPSCRVRSGRT